jgi:hypothetical protein
MSFGFYYATGLCLELEVALPLYFMVLPEAYLCSNRNIREIITYMILGISRAINTVWTTVTVQCTVHTSIIHSMETR